MAFPTQPSRFTRADGSPIRVLVVEDEPSLTGLLSMAMRYEGWDVTTANSGAHAVHEAQATRPDVIVLNDQDADGGPVSAGESGRLRGECHGLRVSRGKSVLPYGSPVIFL